jgi:hypothetical protein
MEPYTRESVPGAGGYSPAPMQQVTAKRRRRSLGTLFRTSPRLRYLVCAALVVLGAVTVPTVYRLATGPTPQVLVALRQLPAGHVIAQGDLGTADGSGPAASVLPGSMKNQLLGHQLKLQVPAGALVNQGDFGPFPPTGMTVVPVAVKPGQYPPNLQGGDQVAVFPTPAASGGTLQPALHAAATARVVQIQSAADSSGTVVVLLETSAAQAPAIAQAPGMVLVTLDAQGDAP